MYNRFSTIAVLLFWLVSVSWLISVKMWPALQRGNPPDYRQEFSAPQQRERPAVAWDLFWNNRPVGYAVSRAYGTSDDPRELRSFVRFENISMREIMQDLLGGMSYFTSSLLGGQDFRLNLTIATELQLDWEGELQSFQTCAKAEDELDLLFLRGQRTEQDRLRISVFAGGDSEPLAIAPLSQEFALPGKTQFSDAFSPRSRMVGLRVGQKWTTPVVSPVGGSNSVRLVESLVEKMEYITWNQQDLETFRIVYRQTGGVSVAGQAAGLAWVSTEGMVLRQELLVGGARVRLERAPEGRGMAKAEILDSVGFDKFLQRNRSGGSISTTQPSASKKEPPRD